MNTQAEFSIRNIDDNNVMITPLNPLGEKLFLVYNNGLKRKSRFIASTGVDYFQKIVCGIAKNAVTFEIS